MAKISKGEYELLKSLDDRWKWIARDEGGNHSGNLFVYSGKPYKNYNTKDWRGNFLEWFSIDNRLLQFVQWEDSKPYFIAELIEEYRMEARKQKSEEE